jgi:hypothetical protein
MSIGRRLDKLETALSVAADPRLCRCNPQHVFIERHIEGETVLPPSLLPDNPTDCPRCGGAPQVVKIVYVKNWREFEPGAYF